MFHLHKTKKFDYKHPEWMNSFINCSLKKKYMARFCNNPPDYNIDLSNECTKPIIQAKDRHIAQMRAQLDSPDIAPKTYRSMISRFLNKRKIPAIPFVLTGGELASDLKIKPELKILILLPSVLK